MLEGYFKWVEGGGCSSTCRSMRSWLFPVSAYRTMALCDRPARLLQVAHRPHIYMNQLVS